MGMDLKAGRLANPMLDRGDYNGQLVWLRVRRAIAEIQALPSGPLH